jgi:hypothetical protein
MKRFNFSKTRNIIFVNINGETLSIPITTVEEVPSKICVLRFHGSAPVKNDICSGSDVTIELRHTKPAPCKKHCCAL